MAPQEGDLAAEEATVTNDGAMMEPIDTEAFDNAVEQAFAYGSARIKLAVTSRLSNADCRRRYR